MACIQVYEDTDDILSNLYIYFAVTPASVQRDATLPSVEQLCGQIINECCGGLNNGDSYSLENYERDCTPLTVILIKCTNKNLKTPATSTGNSA